jgi:polyhydroxybutyrate depolymerase
MLMASCGEPSAPGAKPDSFGGVHPDDCIGASAGVHHGFCESLQFDLHVPAECLERACGLILDVHGSTMTGAQQEAHTSLGALARDRGYVVLQPWAPQMHWDDSLMSPLDTQVLALAERVMNAFSVDRRRVHITGFSQGGYMTWRMLCLRPDLFASFAPIAATASHVLRDVPVGCVGAATAPLAPRPILYAHGTADALVPFSGATETIDALREAWELSSEELLDSGEHYDLVRYSSDDGAAIEFLRHDLRGAYAEEVFGQWDGHCFPGSHEPIGCGAGPAWGEAVLRFFEDHQKN